MAAEMPEERAVARLGLTVTGGDGDAERTGYWTVTGPQDPHEVYAIIERSKSPGDGHVFFAWYLTQRTTPEFNAPSTYMLTIGQGFQPTHEAALEDLAETWLRLLGTR